MENLYHAAAFLIVNTEPHLKRMPDLSVQPAERMGWYGEPRQVKGFMVVPVILSVNGRGGKSLRFRLMEKEL